MLSTNKKPTCWVVSNGWAGTEKQCVALAQALGLSFALKRVKLRFPWNILPECLWFFPLKAYSSKGDQLSPPWPDILISSGRSTSAVTAAIKRQNKNVFTIQIQDPRLPARWFDAVIVPQHSGVKGKNVIQTLGALHGLNAGLLEPAKEEWRSTFEPLKGPRVAVIIGGNSGYYHMTEAWAKIFVAKLEKLLQTGASLMITLSRRTPAFLLGALKPLLQSPQVFYWQGEGANPYLGILSWADHLVVTSDSVSMITEACSLQKPVYVEALTPKQKWRPCRLERFRQNLEAKGYILPFQGHLTTSPAIGFNDLLMIIAQLRKLKIPL